IAGQTGKSGSAAVSGITSAGCWAQRRLNARSRNKSSGTALSENKVLFIVMILLPLIKTEIFHCRKARKMLGRLGEHLQSTLARLGAFSSDKPLALSGNKKKALCSCRQTFPDL